MADSRGAEEILHKVNGLAKKGVGPGKIYKDDQILKGGCDLGRTCVNVPHYISLDRRWQGYTLERSLWLLFPFCSPKYNF